jgi:nicotinamide-nucleotide amidase
MRADHPSTLAESVGVDPARVADLIVQLADRRLTVAACESLTGGLLTALLTAVPGSSAVVRGSLVVYATELKARLAGVDESLLAEHGPVHPEVARQLAAGARRACGSTIGIGLTGVAGPDPQHGLPAGTVYVALAGPEGFQLVSRRPGEITGGSRSGIRAAAVRDALELLERAAGPRSQTPAVASDLGRDVSPTADTDHPGAVGTAE